MTLSRSIQCRAFSRALMDEKSLSPLFPVASGGGGGGGRAGQWLQMTGALYAVGTLTKDNTTSNNTSNSSKPGLTQFSIGSFELVY